MQSSNSNENMGDSFGDQVEKGAKSAFPRLSTNPVIQKAIEDGEINKSDIDLLEKAQRLSGMGQSIGFLVGSVGGFIGMRRMRPQARYAQRFAGFFFGGMLGSFVGFISGSVAGAVDVNSKMPDAKRKLAKIAEITQRAREQRVEELRQRVGQTPLPVPGGQAQIPRSFPPNQGQRYPDSTPSSSFPRSTEPFSTYTSAEDAENQREQAGEADRQRSYKSEVREIERDSRMASNSPFDRDPAPSESYGQSQSNPPIGRPQAGRPPGSAWDRLRQRGEQAIIGPAGGQDGGNYDSGAGNSTNQPARTKEQREFDEMLERERRGIGETETWK